jgi:WD40 repeat protein
MTTFDRFEREIPSLMDEIAPPRMPDYIDDMLTTAAHTRQRPAWASLERWLPMDVVARPAPFRAPVLRPLLVVLLIVLLIAAGLALYAGSQRTRLPEPFGPARNGVIVVGDTTRDISLYDPATGSTTTLITDGGTDSDPIFARDGTKFSFLRNGSVWLANADGSDERMIVPGPVGWFDWSDSTDRIVVQSGVPETTSVVDLASGATTVLDLGVELGNPTWRPGHDQLLSASAGDDGTMVYSLVNADGSGLHAIEGVAAGAINRAQFSPDGSLLTYATWTEEPGKQGVIHVLDVETGIDRVIPRDDSEANELNPLFSPDGSTLLIERHGTDAAYEVADGELGYRLVLVPVNGGGSRLPIGPARHSGTSGANVEFSPDGRQVLATYKEDWTTWLIDVDGSPQVQLPWTGRNGTTWQRLAP